jgi:hypothetical protein
VLLVPRSGSRGRGSAESSRRDCAFHSTGQRRLTPMCASEGSGCDGSHAPPGGSGSAAVPMHRRDPRAIAGALVPATGGAQVAWRRRAGVTEFVLEAEAPRAPRAVPDCRWCVAAECQRAVAPDWRYRSWIRRPSRGSRGIDTEPASPGALKLCGGFVCTAALQSDEHLAVCRHHASSHFVFGAKRPCRRRNPALARFVLDGKGSRRRLVLASVPDAAYAAAPTRAVFRARMALLSSLCCGGPAARNPRWI